MSQYNNGYAVNTRLPKEMYDWIKQTAKVESLSMGQIIRRALQREINEQRPVAARTNKRKFLSR